MGLCLCDRAMGQGSGVHRYIDARDEPNPGQKGMSGVPSLRNSRNLQIRVTVKRPVLTVPGEQQMSLDFVLLNVSRHRMRMPISTDGRRAFSRRLELYVTSSDGKIRSTTTWCADLYDQFGDETSFLMLGDRESIIVHARCRFPAPAEQVSLTAHADLFEISGGTASLVGAAHSPSTLITPRKK